MLLYSERMSRFTTRLASLIDAADSQRAFADKLAISQTLLSRIKNEEQQPPDYVLETIVDNLEPRDAAALLAAHLEDQIPENGRHLVQIESAYRSVVASDVDDLKSFFTEDEWETVIARLRQTVWTEAGKAKMLQAIELAHGWSISDLNPDTETLRKNLLLEKWRARVQKKIAEAVGEKGQ